MPFFFFFFSQIGKNFETIDPRTEEVIALISQGEAEDVDLAVKAAREAFDHGPWPRLPGCVSYICMLRIVYMLWLISIFKYVLE